MEPGIERQKNDRGFDAAVKRREDDYLNRWPFAREIFGIASTGPSDWSVRIGVYGEWGTGKSTVLEFVAAMARKDEHIVIWFNPWEHSTKDALWQAFVLKVFTQPILANIKGAKRARVKGAFGRLWQSTSVIEAGADLVHDKTGKAIGAGLDLVKKLFAFSREDLKSLQKALGGKRILILIDDLDRTVPELVPEILFALKELMDTPGFSFVCAFDPLVVGKVLRRYNPGFGEGLSFLEKIIDYPRWLPPPPQDGLINLALAESRGFSAYVPEAFIRDAVPLLPPNPRAVRQFIRLLALLRPQIERYQDYELNWPIILAANVLKIRHPRIAHSLLKNTGFWESIEQTSTIAQDNQERQQISDRIDAHIERVTSRLNVRLTAIQITEVKTALMQLSGQLNRWALRSGSYLVEQMEIAEAPHAVTWKEYDSFLDYWKANPSKETVQKWVRKHAEKVDRSELRVYTEVFDATIGAYAKSLSEADDKFVDTDKAPFEEKAEALLALTECLVFDLGDLEKTEKKIGIKQLKELSEVVASLSAARSPFHIRLWPRTEQLLVRLIEQWSGDVSMLMTVIHPSDSFRFTHYEGPTVRALHQKLGALLLPKFARQVISGFKQLGFVDHLIQNQGETYDVRSMVINSNGPLWKDHRAEAIQVFEEARSNRAVQENAYELLYWFDYQLREQKGSLEAQQIEALLKDNQIVEILWTAATAAPISARAITRMQRFPDELNKLGVAIAIPGWWTDALKTIQGSPQSTSNEKPQING